MGLVADTASRVEAHLARGQEGAQVGREVARGAVVPRDHERGPLGAEIDQRGEQVRPQAGGHEGPLRRLERSV